MTNFGKSLLLAYLAVATGSATQGVSVASTAPSAVNEMGQSTRPLAGTLFFGQQQRDQMDRARKRGGLSVEGVTDEPESSTLNGFVKRSDGQSAIWIDGQPRFNVQGENVRRLQPGDVGGPADTVRVISSGVAAALPAGNVQRVYKAPPRKPTRKRPATTR